MPLVPEYYTADMVRALPEDGQRYELVHGQLLVSPAPRLLHQLVVRNLSFELIAYSRREKLGGVFTSPAAISWSPDTLVQPDIFAVSAHQLDRREWSEIRSLDLVVEVLSPSTATHDRFQKRRLYQREGVGLLWLVDADRALVEIWTPDALFPTIETEQLTWHPPGAAEPLIVPISSLFSER